MSISMLSELTSLTFCSPSEDMMIVDVVVVSELAYGNWSGIDDSVELHDVG